MALPLGIGPATTNLAGVNAITTMNAAIPPEGPKVVPIALAFSTNAVIIVDFTLANAQAKISAVQMIYLNNKDNPNTVELSCEGTNQIVTVPAHSQGTYPIISTNRPKFTCTSDGGVDIVVHFCNVPLPANEWFPDSGALTGAVGTTIHAIVVGGTAVNVFDPPPTGGAVIINPIAATESLFVDIVNAAGTVAPGTNGTTVELAAGDQFTIPPNFGGIVSANAVTAAHAFTAYGVTL